MNLLKKIFVQKDETPVAQDTHTYDMQTRSNGEHKDVLKDIFFDKAGGYFIGGSLDFPCENGSVLLSFNSEMSDEERFWWSMIYIKSKSSAALYFLDAREYVKQYPDYATLKAKTLLHYLNI